MTMFHKALAAALLTSAVGFAIPSFAADYSSSTAATPSDKGATTAPSSAATSTDKTSPSSTAATSEKGSANATDTNAPAKPAKRVVRARVDAEHSIVEALNQKSLEGAQSGASPDFASAEPASHQQAEVARASKTAVRHRANTKASVKKGA